MSYEELLGLILIGRMLLAVFVGDPISFTLIVLAMVFGYLGFGAFARSRAF